MGNGRELCSGAFLFLRVAGEAGWWRQRNGRGWELGRVRHRDMPSAWTCERCVLGAGKR